MRLEETALKCSDSRREEVSYQSVLPVREDGEPTKSDEDGRFKAVP